MQQKQLQIPPEALRHYIDHWDACVEDCLFSGPIKNSIRNLCISPDQRLMLNAVSQNRQVSIRSGRGCGKTSAISWIIICFMLTRPNARVICTGPKYDQLRDTLWAETYKWLSGSSVSMLFNWTAERIYHVTNPAGWYAIMATAKEKENLSGFHEEHMLIIADEASGIPDEIFETVLGSMTQADNKIVLAGNPTQVTGFFYDTFHRYSDQWKTLHFNSEASPLVSPIFLRTMADKYPKTHDVYRVNVLGEFPLGNPEAYISLADAQAAKSRDVPPSGEVVIGVDVARFGLDLTVVTVRQGNHVFPQITKEKTSIPETATLVIEAVRKYRAICSYEGIIEVKCDDTGVGGGVSDLLRESDDYKDDNIEVVPVVFSTKIWGQFYDTTSYMWGQLKEVIGEIELPDEPNLTDELAARRFKVEGGLIRIEPKSEFKKVFKGSPDRSDSLVLCFARKAGQKKVISGFKRHETTHQNEFKIRWNETTGQSTFHYGSLCLQKDESIYFLSALWDDVVNHLYIYSESMRDYVMPTFLATEIIQKMQLQQYSMERLLGNALMFGEGKTDTARTISRELKKMVFTQNVSVKEVKRYDMIAAIGVAMQMFQFGRITIHKDCEGATKQIESWSLDKRGKPIVDGMGYCDCLLHIVSAIKRKIPDMQRRITIQDYRPINARSIVDKKEKETQGRMVTQW